MANPVDPGATCSRPWRTKEIVSKVLVPRVENFSTKRSREFFSWKAPYGCFRKWWYPTTIGFPTKNDHFGVFWEYHHLRKHPYEGKAHKKMMRYVRYVPNCVFFSPKNWKNYETRSFIPKSR